MTNRELPPLPEPARQVVYNESKGYTFGAYTADQMREYARAALAQSADIAAKLKDPVTVFAAMLRGEIATPAIRDMLHVYGADALARWDNAQSAASGEPNMRHPKIQALISSNARNNIELQLIEQLLDDPNCELTSMDMEYWHGLHDKLRDRLLTAAQK